MIAYQRLSGPNCIDEMYAIYPDGRVEGDNGTNQVETNVDPDTVERVLSTISNEYAWFTDEIFDTYLAPCRQCFVHYVLISYDGQEKGATATDGTTAMPSEYGFTLSVITPLLPEIDSLP